MIDLTDEQRTLVESVRDLAEREFAENACTWEGERPQENIERLGEEGLLGINLPEAYGGGGLSEIEAVLVSETIGRVCPDTAYASMGHQMVAPRAIDMFASDEAKERYLPGVIEGTESISIAISEPHAGSDVKSMHTHASECDGELVLNGEKTWVGGVREARAAVVWVKFLEGLGTVIMDFDDPGVEVKEHYTNMMGRTQTHFTMTDVRIPVTNVLTRGRHGFKEQLQALNWERIGSATLANATAICALEKALAFAEEREQFGQPIGEFQGIAWKLADAAKRVQAARALTYQAAQYAAARGESPSKLDTSLAKLYSSEILERVVSEALQIHGARGYQRGHELEYLYRFARSRRIAAGTDEMMKNAVADALRKDGFPNLA